MTKLADHRIRFTPHHVVDLNLTPTASSPPTGGLDPKVVQDLISRSGWWGPKNSEGFFTVIGWRSGDKTKLHQTKHIIQIFPPILITVEFHNEDIVRSGHKVWRVGNRVQLSQCMRTVARDVP